MKYFGFIKEHDSYSFATAAKQLMGDVEDPNRSEVIAYLKKGVLCVAWMGCVENVYDPNYDTDDYDDDSFFAYYAIDTDGEYYWPQYFQVYLEKYPTLIIDPEFVQHVKKNKEHNIKVSDPRISELEK